MRINEQITRLEHLSIMGGNKWTDFFKSEEELMDSLKNIDLRYFDFKYTNTPIIHCDIKGYVYIIPFSEKVKKGEILTKKQITQAKRLACQIKLAEVKSNDFFKNI